MATAEHAITVNDEAMELPVLPPNQGVEAMKDIVFGSVSRCSRAEEVEKNKANYDRLLEWPENSLNTPSTPSKSDYNLNQNTFPCDIQVL